MGFEKYKNTISTAEAIASEVAFDDKIKVAGIDLDGILRGKEMSRSKFLESLSGGFGYCSIIFGWDMHDNEYSNPELLVSNRANGYRDIKAHIDAQSFRRNPVEEDRPFCLLSFCEPDDGAALFACPRQMLRGQLAKAGDDQCLLAGVEFEYYNMKETVQTAHAKNFMGLSPLTPGNFGYSISRTNLNQEYFHELYATANKFGIEIEAHHTETGPGVYETALAYTDATRMADNACLFKYIAKSVGSQFGIMPTFMAKPYADQAGTSGHVHVSMKNSEGVNLFAAPGGTPREGAYCEDTKYLSVLGEQFLAGVMEGLKDVMPMLCPNINSYKRLVAGDSFFAPNTASYGLESRLASVRIISPPVASAASTRLEIRVPGADMHPHLALSAIFGLGLRGIRRQTKLSWAPVTAKGDNIFKGSKLALTLEAATAEFMRPESIARELFGDDFVNHFGGTRLHEILKWNSAVTQWESERYMELV